MSAEKCPPVRGLSKRQQGAITYFGKKFHPSEYKSFDFSPAFKAIYGETTAYDSDWDRLTSTPFNKDLIPKSRKYNFLEFVNEVTFLYFAKSADEKASTIKCPVLNRREMEAMYVHVLLKKFDAFTKEQLRELIGIKQWVYNEEKALEYLQKQLEHAVKDRFHPIGKIEEYWSEKPATFNVPDLDVKKLADGADEPEEEMNSDYEDEDDDSDAFMSDGGDDKGNDVSKLSSDLKNLDTKDDSDSEGPDITHEEAMARLQASIYSKKGKK